MEAAQAFHRCLYRVVAQPSRCCPHASSRTKKVLTPRHVGYTQRITAPPHSSSRRFFSSSARRTQDSATETRNPITPESAPNVPTSPVEARQALESYLRDVNKIISHHQLKERLPYREFETVVVAATKAEAFLGAPNLSPESFSPTLKSFTERVGPVLQKHFNSQDVEDIVQRSPLAPEPSVSTRGSASKGNTPANSDSSPSPSSTVAQTMDLVFGPGPVRRDTRRLAPESNRSTQAQHFDFNALFGHLGSRGGSGSSEISEAERARNRETSLAISRQLDSGDGSLGQMNALRLKPTLGRTVDVTPSFDLTRAFRQLEILAARNKVKRDEIKQRKHVRRGQAVKILRRERWKRQFKDGFIAECERVRRMWKQGW